MRVLTLLFLCAGGAQAVTVGGGAVLGYANLHGKLKAFSPVVAEKRAKPNAFAGQLSLILGARLCGRFGLEFSPSWSAVTNNVHLADGALTSKFLSRHSFGGLFRLHYDLSKELSIHALAGPQVTGGTFHIMAPAASVSKKFLRRATFTLGIGLCKKMAGLSTISELSYTAPTKFRYRPQGGAVSLQANPSRIEVLIGLRGRFF